MATTIPTTAERPAQSNRLTIDIGAVQRNWRTLDARSNGAVTGAVVKADCYGLGMSRLAPALWTAGARRFYVAQIQEGVALRRVLPEAEILVMAPTLPESLAAARNNRLIVTLNSVEAIAAWRADAAGGAPLPANLHLETGMTRLGMTAAVATAAWAAFSMAEQAAIVEISSHLACADMPSHPANRAQLDRFQAAIAQFPPGPLRSLANSSGIFLGAGYIQTAVRPGMALYGLNPMPGRPNPMESVVTLEARVLQTRTLAQAETVGYGATAAAPAGARIATIAIGYADGLVRRAADAGAVYFDGRRAPIIGRISMDLTGIDVSHLQDDLARPGDWAEVIGAHQSADALAAAAGTIGYEMLTGLGSRLTRDYRTTGA